MPPSHDRVGLRDDAGPMAIIEECTAEDQVAVSTAHPLRRGDLGHRRYDDGPVTLTTALVAVAEPDGVLQLTLIVLFGPL